MQIKKKIPGEGKQMTMTVSNGDADTNGGGKLIFCRTSPLKW